MKSTMAIRHDAPIHRRKCESLHKQRKNSKNRRQQEAPKPKQVPAKRRMNETLKRHSPHVVEHTSPSPSPSSRQGTKSSGHGQPLPCDLGSGSRLSKRPSSGEYMPRKRRSQYPDTPKVNEEELIENVAPTHTYVVNKTFLEVCPASDACLWSKRLLFCSTHMDQMSTQFEFTHKIYRCSLGVTQPSRSKGHRSRKSAFCKCNARLTAIVVPIAANQYGIVVRKQNHTHSHATIAALATTPTKPLHDKPKLTLRATEIRLLYRQDDAMLDPDCSPKVPPSPDSPVPDELSSDEKYSHAKTRLEPLLQGLSNLPSANYYQELSSLETTLKMEIIRRKTRSDSTDGESLGEKMEGPVAGDPADSHVTQSPPTKLKEILQSRLKKEDVRLDDFDQWARHTSSVKDVAALMEKYPMQLKEQDITALTIEC
ncbi:hypothetical protein PHYSODRAFT_299215 [Phytophthora sojae]|uniref:Uncharacterized protein n=1 Tax=Phytophthora sojae (strain P6497) TaxID=1094619 RepID=G4Z3E4_PHYSP|nr:hypothetical protein PHYSODRAFT_299215 [Phytophthora sojae]EGZ21507.1 hypothetical protein PHYSODRAFT_299215 [Phytophthora sojae]|eukprot:XP_009524224.1 hypothetical protein PHYSODRAFT_299215 [Phytophthora sojae]